MKILILLALFASTSSFAEAKTRYAKDMTGLDRGVLIEGFYSLVTYSVEREIKHFMKHNENIKESDYRKFLKRAVKNYSNISARYRREYYNKICNPNFKPERLRKFEEKLGDRNNARYIISYDTNIGRFDDETAEAIQVFFDKYTENTSETFGQISEIYSDVNKAKSYITEVCTYRNESLEVITE